MKAFSERRQKILKVPCKLSSHLNNQTKFKIANNAIKCFLKLTAVNFFNNKGHELRRQPFLSKVYSCKQKLEL